MALRSYLAELLVPYPAVSLETMALSRAAPSEAFAASLAELLGSAKWVGSVLTPEASWHPSARDLFAVMGPALVFEQGPRWQYQTARHREPQP